jgi:hypothetical protein
MRAGLINYLPDEEPDPREVIALIKEEHQWGSRFRAIFATKRLRPDKGSYDELREVTRKTAGAKRDKS